MKLPPLPVLTAALAYGLLTCVLSGGVMAGLWLQGPSEQLAALAGVAFLVALITVGLWRGNGDAWCGALLAGAVLVASSVWLGRWWPVQAVAGVLLLVLLLAPAASREWFAVRDDPRW